MDGRSATKHCRTRQEQEGFFLLVLSACISMAADGKGSKGVAFTN